MTRPPPPRGVHLRHPLRRGRLPLHGLKARPDALQSPPGGARPVRTREAVPRRRVRRAVGRSGARGGGRPARHRPGAPPAGPRGTPAHRGGPLLRAPDAAGDQLRRPGAGGVLLRGAGGERGRPRPRPGGGGVRPGAGGLPGRAGRPQARDGRERARLCPGERGRPLRARGAAGPAQAGAALARADPGRGRGAAPTWRRSSPAGWCATGSTTSPRWRRPRPRGGWRARSG